MKRFRLVLLLLLLAATAGFVAWFGPRGGKPGVGRFALWVVADTVQVRHDDGPQSSAELYDGNTIHLAAARNEVIAWQVVIRSPRTLVDGKVALSAFHGDKGDLPADSCRIFTEHYLKVEVPSQFEQGKPPANLLPPGELPNQLLPLSIAAHGFEASPGQSTPLWFDLTVPEDAAPGKYAAKLDLSAGAPLAGLPIELEVYPFALPRATHFTTWFYYGPEQLSAYYKDPATAASQEEEFRRLAHDHRMTLAPELYVPGDPGKRTAWWHDRSGWWDGREFPDGPCRGTGDTCLPIGLGDAKEAPVKAMARATTDFFGGLGLLDKAFVFAYDEPHGAEAYRQVRDVGAWIKSVAGPRLKVFVTAPVEPEKAEWGSLEDAVDIFCSGQTSTVEMRRWHERGGRIWVYNQGLAGAGLIDTPLSGVAAWGPASWRFGLDGWFLWDTLYWRQTHVGQERMTDLYVNPLTFDETLKHDAQGRPYPEQYAIRLNGDGVWLCPGEPVGGSGPIATMRVKAFRRGAQDYEYLWLLAEHHLKAKADGFARRLSTNRGEWELDADAWLACRRDMAKALMEAKE
jgi:hypothetical protein